MNSTGGVDQILGQIRALRQQTAVRPEAPAAGEPVNPLGGFGDLLKQSVESVNQTQQTAKQMQSAYTRGEGDISLAQVMVSMQKADVSFRATVEVRNKMIDAYHEVMRMSV